MKKYRNIFVVIFFFILVIMLKFSKKNFYLPSNTPYKAVLNKKTSHIKDFFYLNRKEDKLIILNHGNYKNYNNIEILYFEYYATGNGILISRWHSLDNFSRINIYINDQLMLNLNGKTEAMFNNIAIKKGDIVKCFFYYGHIDYYLSVLY